MIPRLDSVWPIGADCLRMRMWQAMEISHPPPSAWPLMAAMTGLGNRSMRRSTELPKRMKEVTSGPEKAEPRSAPAQKILSPAPVMMRHWTAPSDSISDSTAFSSFINRSEEHTSELQSPDHLVCRLLLEKKKKKKMYTTTKSIIAN